MYFILRKCLILRAHIYITSSINMFDSIDDLFLSIVDYMNLLYMMNTVIN